MHRLMGSRVLDNNISVGSSLLTSPNGLTNTEPFPTEWDRVHMDHQHEKFIHPNNSVRQPGGAFKGQSVAINSGSIDTDKSLYYYHHCQSKKHNQSTNLTSYIPSSNVITCSGQLTTMLDNSNFLQSQSGTHYPSITMTCANNNYSNHFYLSDLPGSGSANDRSLINSNNPYSMGHSSDPTGQKRPYCFSSNLSISSMNQFLGSNLSMSQVSSPHLSSGIIGSVTYTTTSTSGAINISNTRSSTKSNTAKKRKNVNSNKISNNYVSNSQILSQSSIIPIMNDNDNGLSLKHQQLLHPTNRVYYNNSTEEIPNNFQNVNSIGNVQNCYFDANRGSSVMHQSYSSISNLGSEQSMVSFTHLYLKF